MRYCMIDDDMDGQVCSTGYCVLRVESSQVLPRWLFYLVGTSAFKTYVEKNQQGTSYPAISNKCVKAFRIPVPSLEEQKRIVGILDKFEALCADLSRGLPGELALRRKQFAYYRERLLTFKELAS